MIGVNASGHLAARRRSVPTAATSGTIAEVLSAKKSTADSDFEPELTSHKPSLAVVAGVAVLLLAGIVAVVMSRGNNTPESKREAVATKPFDATMPPPPPKSQPKRQPKPEVKTEPKGKPEPKTVEPKVEPKPEPRKPKLTLLEDPKVDPKPGLEPIESNPEPQAEPESKPKENFYKDSNRDHAKHHGNQR